MKALSILCLALVAVLASCSKDDDPKYSSAEGTWTYTTPDSKISVDFTLALSGGTWSVTNPVIRVDGTSGNAAVKATGINPPSVANLRINANDSKLTYPYSIEFAGGVVSDDFTQITVPGATYTWPFDQANNLTNITIRRK